MERRMRNIMIQDLKRYDVVLVDFGRETIGSEQGGLRPAVIIQNDVGNLHSGTTIVFPFTTQLKRLNQPTHTLIAKGEHKGLVEDSMVLGEAIRQVDQKRIKGYLGSITDVNEREEIKRVYNANFGE